MKLLHSLPCYSFPTTPFNPHQARVAFPGQNREDLVDSLQMQEGAGHEGGRKTHRCPEAEIHQCKKLFDAGS